MLATTHVIPRKVWVFALALVAFLGIAIFGAIRAEGYTLNYHADGSSCSRSHALVVEVSNFGSTSGSARRYVETYRKGDPRNIRRQTIGARIKSRRVVLCRGMYVIMQFSKAKPLGVTGPPHFFKLGTTSGSKLVVLPHQNDALIWVIFARYRRYR